MHSLTLLLVAATLGCSVAHYQDWYDTRNALYDEEDPISHTSEETAWCRIARHHSSKNCNYGTHINTACGFRRDCLQGPGEQCTEKMEDDRYGLKCAEGYICHKIYARCIGPHFNVETNNLLPFMWGPGHVLEGRPLRQYSNYYSSN